MAYTQQQLDDIKAARATGATRIATPNLVTEFRSLSEMDQIISSMERELAGGSSAARSRSSLTSFSKD